MPQRNKKNLLLLHPEKSRIFWHDLKKYLTIEEFLLSNLNSGVYGKIPQNLHEPLNELEKNNIHQLIFIDIMSVLSKVELGYIPKFTLEETNAKKLSETSLIFLQKNFLAKKTSFFSNENVVGPLQWLEFLCRTQMYILSRVYENILSEYSVILEEKKGKLLLTTTVVCSTRPQLPKSLFSKALTLKTSDEVWFGVLPHLSSCLKLTQFFKGKIEISAGKTRPSVSLTSSLPAYGKKNSSRRR